jgi:ribosomal protein L37AE/L43A
LNPQPLIPCITAIERESSRDVLDASVYLCEACGRVSLRISFTTWTCPSCKVSTDNVRVPKCIQLF